MKSRLRTPIAGEIASMTRSGSPLQREKRTRSVRSAGRDTEATTSRTRSSGRAKTLEGAQVTVLLDYVRRMSSVPESDVLKILYSYYAGMRACEIAKLRIEDVTDADGRVATQITIRGVTTKNGRDRTVPMHPDIKKAINAFRAAYPDIMSFAISGRHSKIRVQSVHALTVWFHWIYKKAGFQGCSSHSGRRTFITKLARTANNYNGSLKDVQLLAGHARLDTTERYIEPSESLFDLINSLGRKPRTRRRRGGKRT